MNVQGNPDQINEAVADSGCSRHMTGHAELLDDFIEFDVGSVTFGGSSRGRITRRGTLKSDKLILERVYFVKELEHNLISVSQLCDSKTNVLFTDKACLVLSPDFQLPDPSQVLLNIPRKWNMYCMDLRSFVTKDKPTCLVAKVTLDESMLWHRRLGHVNFKNLNKLSKEGLVTRLPVGNY